METIATRLHEVSLDFDCPTCGFPVYKMLYPADEFLPHSLWSIVCRCGVYGYAEDLKADAQNWPALMRKMEAAGKL